VFEHKQGMEKGKATFAEVKDTLQELCQVTKDDIRPQVTIVYTLKIK
jgi:hypothetical protein